MTTQIAREEYSRLVSRFGAARRAWKRAAVLSGTVVVVIEGLGTFTVAALADLLFSPSLAGRVAILAAGTGVVAFFVARHMVKPLTRKISNKQLALYLEERNPDFEGSLLAAAEFGAADMPQGRQAEIVDSILHEAVRRAEKFDIRKAIDFSRFRKYGLVAAAGLVLYVGAGLLLPQSVGNRFARIFTPWRATPEETRSVAPAAASKEPIRFALSRREGDVLRGSTFELEAALSRTPSEDVVFNFRPRGEAAADTWKSLPMKELEKLNTFHGALPDVNEEFEFYISSGAYKTDAYRIGVYDPLTLKSIQITAAYPAYMKLPAVDFRNDQGDISAPVGSTITMRIATNRPLQSGDILWEKESPVAGTVDPAHKDTLVVSFPVKDTAGYRYSLKDVTNQLLTNSSAATLTAVVDQPPAVKLIKPGEKFSGNPMSEIAFVAEATDDYGLDSGELVVVRQLEGTANETRLKVAFDADLSAAAVTSAKAQVVLSLETLSPPVQAGEVISCNLEVRDRKGQVAVSELCAIDVIPYAAWAYYFDDPPHAGEHVQYFLEPVLAATWSLHRSKASVAPREFNRQAQDIAATMVDPNTGAIVPYFSPLKKSPEQIVHGDRAMKFAKDANEALKKHDTAKASRDLQIALAELKLAGYSTLMVVSKPPETQYNASAKFQEEMKRMSALVQQKEPPASATTKAAQAEADHAAEAAKAEGLRKKQAEIVEQIRKAMQAEKPAKEIEKAAGAQEKNAGEAEKLAGTVKKNAGGNEERTAAGSDLQNATEAMRNADAPLKKGDLANGLAKAETALKHLTAATEKLNASSQDRINQMLAKAAEIAQELQRKQEELVKASEAKPKPEETKPLGEKQVKLVSRLRDLSEIIEQLQKAGANGALKPETAKHVDEAAKEIKRGRLEQKISNAVVELTAGKADGALPHQAKALESFTKVRDELVAANDARATDVATALKQAKAQADKLREKLEDLGAKPQAKAAASQAATQTAATQKGAATQMAATQKGAASQAAASQPANRNENANQAADAAKRLAEQLGARDFAKNNKEFQADVNAIKEAVKNRSKLVDELEKVPDAPDKFARLAERLTHRLEAEILANEQAKRLFEAQREDCPPEYRQLVNRYFETLSKREK